MKRRQTSLPTAWLIVDRPVDADLAKRIRRLPRGSGVLVLGRAHPSLRRAARGMAIIEEGRRQAARAHDVVELRRALLDRTPLVLLSPIYPTASHPDWRPMPRMRAAALARLANRRLIALGGMNARRFARIAPLGFAGWAGISAWSAR